MLTRGNAVAGGAAGIGILCGVLAAVLAGPAGAGKVRVQGQAVLFEANAGEVNTVVVTHIPGNDESTIEIGDSTAPLLAVPPCSKNGPDAVVCTVQQPSFVSLDLGNKDDKASQTFTSTGLSLRMRIFGGLGNDTLSGGFNEDAIDGGPGTDVIEGDDGDDVLTGGSGNDRLRGGRGNDTIDGQLGDDPELRGDAGSDVIHGGPGGDTLIGGAGSDELFGDIGNDSLNGRDGETDALDCGTGNDTVDRDASDTTKRCR
jgi:Ca2+-binding RTX toxin-like protein